MEHFDDKARIKKVQNRVFNAADILVNGEPLVDSFLVKGLCVVLGGQVAQEIPRAVNKGVHCVGFALCVLAALWALCVHESCARQKRGLAAAFKFNVSWQKHRKLFVRHGHHAAVRAIDNRNRSAPVTLARDEPVAKLEVDRCLSDFFFFHPCGDFPFSVFVLKPVKFAGVNKCAGLGIGFFENRVRVHVRALDYIDEFKAVFSREYKVARVVGRNGHYRAGAIFH